LKIAITRVSLSIPCRIPVLPGTFETDAPLETRTEFCAVDAFWFVGLASTCDVHLRIVMKLMGDDFEVFLEDFLKENPDYRGHIPNAWESKPWYERHRYEQDMVRRMEHIAAKREGG